MSELQVHLALIRENWDRHDHWFDALCNNLVRGHMKELEALAAQSPPPVVSEGLDYGDVAILRKRNASGEITASVITGGDTVSEFEAQGYVLEILNGAALSSPSRGCDAGEDYGPGSPWSEGYNSGFAAGSREPSRGCDLDTVEAAQRLQDHMEQHHGVCLKASEWEAAIRNLGKETREGEGE